MKRNGFVLTALLSCAAIAGAAEIEGLVYDATVNREGTGFFRVEQENGVWRFITPGGHGFFLAGSNGPSRMQGDPCPALGYSPYTRAMEQAYGKDVARWAADSNARLKSWGFNAVSTWDDPVPGVITNGIVHARVVLLGRSFAGRAPNSDSNLLDNVNYQGQFPNVFRPDFADHCLEMAQRVCASRRDDPSLVGWYTDNEVDWRGAKRTGDATDGAGIYDAVAQLAPEHSGRQALERFLAERGLKVADPVPLAVKQDFLRLVAREYYRVTTSAIRAADPNHLVLGCRFAGFLSAPDIAWEEGGKWNDVMTVNAYPPVDLEEGVVRAHWKDRRPIREKLRDVYALCKRPIVVTEWSFPANDTGHPNKNGAGQRVPTQKERAAASALFVRTLLSEPCVIGHVHFRWVDQPKLGRWTKVDGEDCNYGLVNEEGEPYALLTEAFTEVHRKMYDCRHACSASR